MQKNNEMSKSFAAGALLAFVGGYLDAYSYLIRDGVFANAQTGNIVLLGINIAQNNFDKVPHYVIPVASFALGILAAELIKSKFRYAKSIHWRQIVVLAELILLAVCAFIPNGIYNSAVNVVISFVCALQVEAFRVISGNSVATTMCTGNLRSATELLFLGIKDKSRQLILKSLTYYAIIFIFVFGAVLGALITNCIAEPAVLICCVVLAAVLAIMFKK